MMANGAASWHRLSKPRKQVYLAHSNIFSVCGPCLKMGTRKIVSLCLVSVDLRVVHTDREDPGRGTCSHRDSHRCLRFPRDSGASTCLRLADTSETVVMPSRGWRPQDISVRPEPGCLLPKRRSSALSMK